LFGFLKIPPTFYLLRPHHLATSVFVIPFGARAQFSHLYKKNDKIVVLSILIFMVLDRRRDNKRF